ncbi:MAG: NAD(P)/FAD-dependent oxidoreductase [Deltaproteobacteria bacterium]|nr:NAD(P)/FAD-dependent oxidoreductase [Deltaproteobacteria bacterium]
MTTHYDDLVIGTGMGGLTVGAMLAKSGRRVLLLEAHDTAGGYAHTFQMKDYRFCAQVHYIFNCGEGETIHRFLSRLGVAEQVPFVRLDPEGFDHVVVGGERFRIPNGLAKFRERLMRQFPEAHEPLRRYFEVIAAIADGLDRLDAVPPLLSPAALLAAWRYRHVIRHLRWTLEDLYDDVQMPPKLRAILAGQCGDYLLPPRDVSLLLHVALVSGYDRGAYYPKRHYFHFIETIVEAIRAQPGCAVLLEHEVERIHVERGQVVGVTAKNGARFTADRYISNVDPKRTARLAGEQSFTGQDAERLDYDYSSGTITLYLGIRGLDLREHGFGSHNVWHYPHADLNRIYDDQLLRNDLRDPWLFLSTPTLHSEEPGLCPPGDQILEVATSCDEAHFAQLRRRDRRAYNFEKKRLRDHLLDVLERHYLPGLRRHLVKQVMGTPATNERFCWAPLGNSYGAALTPRHVGLARKPYRSSLKNLWLVNATAGFPSVAGTVSAGLTLYRELSGDAV